MKVAHKSILVPPILDLSSKGPYSVRLSIFYLGPKSKLIICHNSNKKSRMLIFVSKQGFSKWKIHFCNVFFLINIFRIVCGWHLLGLSWVKMAYLRKWAGSSFDLQTACFWRRSNALWESQQRNVTVLILLCCNDFYCP